MKKILLTLLGIVCMTSLSAQYTQTTTPTCLASPAGTPITFTFNSVPSPAAGGTVTVYYQGDFDNPTEFGTVFDENAVSLGQTPQSTGQCFASQDSVSFPLTVADLASYAADGVMIFSLTPQGTINPTLCNPCGVLNAKISYPPVTGPDDAAAVGIGIGTGAVFCSGVQPITADIVNAGTNQITSVMVNWEVNGVAQTAVAYTSTLDTLGGTGSNAATVALGSLTFSPGTTNIRAWTSMPNNVPDTSNLNDTTARSAGPSLAGTFTVDGSNPSAGTNFNNFGDLTAAFSSFGVCGPVVVNVAPGVYTDPLLLSNIAGADSINNILIDGGSSATTIMNGTGNFYTIAFQDIEFVTVQNMGIVNNGTTAMAVVFGPNASKNTVRDCEIKVLTTSTSSNVNPIGSSNSLTTRSTNAIGVDNNVVEGNRMVGGYYGVYFYGGSGNLQFGNRVLNNQIDSVWYYGVYGYYQDQMTVIGNTADVALRGNVNGDGIYGLYNTNGIFTDNYMHAIDYGFYISNSSTLAGPTYQKTLIANNMIISQNDYGMYLNAVDQVNLFHNSITAGGTTTPALQIQGSSTYPLSSYDVRNNILASMNTEALEISGVPDTFFTKFDNNAFYTTGATLIRANNTNYADLTAYKAVATTYNLASIEGDPQFLSPTDLHIIGAFVNDMGDNSVGITTDIDGDTRPFPGATTVDIGADEFAPPLCPPVSNIATTNATLNSIDLYWDGVAGNSWEYEVTIAGSGQGSGSTSVVAVDSVTVSGLTPSIVYDFYVREICGRGDTSLWLGPVTAGTAIGIPYLQDFQNFGNNTSGLISAEGWYTLNTPTPHWESGSSTSSSNTGPTADHTVGSGGTFLYLETSGGAAGASDDLWSPSIYVDPSFNSVEFSFWYHMFGAQMGSLEVYVESASGSTLITTLTGQQTAAQGDPWQLFVTNLSGYAGQSIQLRFKGIRGTGYQSDVSIDDVALNILAPLNAGVISTIGNLLPDCPGSSTPVVGVKNFGTDTLTSVKVLWDVNGALDSVTYTNTIFPGDTVPVTLGSISAPVPGSYNFSIYTKDPNNGLDAVAADDTLSTTEVLLPASGGTIAGADTICMGDTITITTDNYMGTLQWESSANGTTWSSIPSATGKDLVISPTALTYYRVMACATVPSDTLGVLPISLSAPTAMGDTAVPFCNTPGTAIAIASSTNPAASFDWYDASVGGNKISTGGNYSLSSNGDSLSWTATTQPFMPVEDTVWVEEVTSGGTGGPTLLITEADLGGTDALEIQNVSGKPIDVTGWTVAVSDNYTNINQVNGTVKTLSGTWAPGQTQYWTDGATNSWGSNLFWNPGAHPSFTGWAIIIDDQGDIVDFLIWAWPAADIGTMSINVAGFTVTPGASAAWIGNGVNSNALPAGSSLYRQGSSDNNDASDFIQNPINMGVTNVGLTIPFAGGGCASTRIPAYLMIDCTVGIEDQESVNSLSISPNPSNGLFNISINAKELNNYNISLRDINGKIIHEDRLSGSGQIRKDIDLSYLAKGVYFMQIQSGEAIRVEKLIIQ